MLNLGKQDRYDVTKTLKNKIILANMPGWAKL